MAAALTGKLVVGTLSGYLIGNFTKQLTDKGIWYAGLTCILVGGLHHIKWVTINFKEIQKDIMEQVEKVDEPEEQMDLLKKASGFFKKVAPLLAGFGSGFYYGFMAG